LLSRTKFLFSFQSAIFCAIKGFTVIEAGNAREALSVLSVRAGVALVLTDIDMSGGERRRVEHMAVTTVVL
jgi:CheY-like chemotaxis protein